MLHLLGQTEKNFWMPEGVSTFSSDVDWLFYFILIVSAVFFFLIAGLMFTFMFLYRRRSEDQEVSRVAHNTPLEIAWSVLPSILLVLMFWWGFQTYMDMRTPPANTYDIQVTAYKWGWEFTHPSGETDRHLHVPVDTPIKLVMKSNDVIHSCFIPAMRVKQDVVPGRFTSMWFEAQRTGRYQLFCAEYCGTEHSNMLADVHVYPKDGFAEVLRTMDPFNALTPEEWEAYHADPAAFIKAHEDDERFAGGKLLPLAEMGRYYYEKKNCKQCHSLDGATAGMTGPTWLGLWGSPRKFRDGSSIPAADENYILSSIRDPGLRIVEGYDNVMSKIAVNDREATALIEFIKSLKK